MFRGLFAIGVVSLWSSSTFAHPGPHHAVDGGTLLLAGALEHGLPWLVAAVTVVLILDRARRVNAGE